MTAPLFHRETLERLTGAINRALPLLLVAGTIGFFLSPLAWNNPPDDEEYRNTLLTTTLYVKAMLNGDNPYWTSALGFGLPTPLHPSLLIHPMTPLLAVVRPDVFARLLYLAHTVVGAVGWWWLVRRIFGVTPWVAAVAVTTFVLSTPTLNYSIGDLWLANFMSWSMLPVLVGLALRLIDASSPRQRWRVALVFGGIAGLVVANGHAGYVPVALLPVALILAMQPLQTVRRLPPLLLATIIGVAIAAPTIFGLYQETSRFDPSLRRLTVDVAIGWRAAVEMFTRPFLVEGSNDMFLALADRGLRLPFFGGPMLLLALWYCAGRSGRPKAILWVPFLVSLAVLFNFGLDRWGVLSGTYTFRDPVTVFGIIAGSLGLQALGNRRRWIALGCGIVQVTVMFVSAWPYVSRSWEETRTATLFRGTPVTGVLGRWAQRLPGRWYLAPQLDEAIRSGDLIAEGLWPDGWAYKGLPVVNGTFKGISVDPLYESGSYPIGRIRGEVGTVTNATSLDVLGIGVVLSLGEEPVAASLEEIWRVETSSGPVHVWRNPGSWPVAVFLDGAAQTAALPRLAGCEDPGFLCRNLDELAQRRQEETVAAVRRNGTIDLQFVASPQERLLLVGEMYRAAWSATTGGKSLPVVPMAEESFIGVRVPPGVESVELRYRPVKLQVLMYLSYLTVVVVAAALMLSFRARGAVTPIDNDPT